MKTVEVQSIRPFFRPSFSAMLKDLGTGLQRLILEDSSWIQGRDFLPPALAKMTGLRQISIRYLANDMMVLQFVTSFNPINFDFLPCH